MNVRVRIQYKRPKEEDWKAMHSLGRSLTAEPKSVRVSADSDSEWLVVEFTMPTEAQYKAMPKIEKAIKLHARAWHDVRFGFPYTEAEQARADRRAARRKARREANRREQPPSAD